MSSTQKRKTHKVKKKKSQKNKSQTDWIQILNDIDIEFIPAEYLHSARIIFESGVVWDIDFKDNNSDAEIEEAINSIINHYELSISYVDFEIDKEKVKNNVSKRTHCFLKKRK